MQDFTFVEFSSFDAQVVGNEWHMKHACVKRQLAQT